MGRSPRRSRDVGVVLTIKIESDTVVISNTEPDQEVIFKYLPGSERVRITMSGPGGDTDWGVVHDLGMVIQALTAIKTTQDNERRRNL